MRNYSISACVLGLLIIIIVWPFSACHKKTGLEEIVHEYTLGNGMKWLLAKKAYAPVFAGVLQVKAGGVDEKQGKTGLSHMLEHMAFKGTTAIGTNEFLDILMRNGASNLNAYTGKDVTTYFAELPNSKLELWLYLMSDMISDPLFREFYSERDVVVEELRTSTENRPIGRLYKALQETAFQNSPYNWPTIGKKEDVANLTLEDLKVFYQAHYQPACMVGAIVGDIDIGETKRLINEYFGKLKGEGNVCHRTIEIDAPQKELRRRPVKFEAEPMLLMAFHKPTVPNFDDYIFDIFSYVLCEGESSRLQKDLVKDRRIAKQIACFNSYPGNRLDNLFVIYAEPFNAGSLDKLEEAIIEELKKLEDEGVGSKELEKVKNQMKAGFLMGIDSNFELAHMLVTFENLADSWRYVVSHPDNVDKITNSDIKDAAGKYFRPANMTVITLTR